MTKPLSSTPMREMPANADALLALPAQAKLILQLLKKIKYGSLRLECPDHSVLHFGDHSMAGDQVMRLRKLLAAAGVEPERDYPL